MSVDIVSYEEEKRNSKKKIIARGESPFSLITLF
jgi:hypothetical protein